MEIPTTLKGLLEKEANNEFKLAVGYFAELKHGLMGNFPAIENESEEMVITTDFELLKQVCAMLTPRPFKFGTQLIYVNRETGIAYSILSTDAKKLGESTPFQTLTRTRFQELIKKEKPFKWAPGLVGKGITKEEFKETLELAASICE